MEEIYLSEDNKFPNCKGIINAAGMPDGYAKAIKENRRPVLAITLCIHCAIPLLLKDGATVLITEEELCNMHPLIQAQIRASMAFVNRKRQERNN